MRSHKNVSRKKYSPKLAVEKHLGIIASRALFYWRLLPPAIRRFIDPEDMVAEVTVQVIKASSYFDPNKSKRTTFIWRVAENCCRTILSRYTRAKHTADLVEIGELDFSEDASQDQIRFQNALDGVERVLEEACGSPETYNSPLRVYLQDLLQGSLSFHTGETVVIDESGHVVKIPLEKTIIVGTDGVRVDTLTNWPPEIRKQLLRAAAKHHVGYQDFHLVLSKI